MKGRSGNVVHMCEENFTHDTLTIHNANIANFVLAEFCCFEI